MVFERSSLRRFEVETKVAGGRESNGIDSGFAGGKIANFYRIFTHIW